MKLNTNFKLIFFLLAIFSTLKIFAHPTGNMITVGENVLWSYVNPINDSEHHACVMIWSQGSKPKVLITSKHPGSDFMLYNKEDTIYIIERRFIQTAQKFEIRILKTKLGEKPREIWDWFEDDMRIGESGFFMETDDQIVFGKHPNIYKLKKGGKSTKLFDFDASIMRIRAIGESKILLLGERSCWLTDLNGNVIRQWDNLLAEQIENTPLNRNQIFDIDYYNGNLLLAYWGKRSFEIIYDNGARKTLLQQNEPSVPHWVAFYGNHKLLFSSELIFDGSSPKPNLILYKSDSVTLEIWKN